MKNNVEQLFPKTKDEVTSITVTTLIRTKEGKRFIIVNSTPEDRLTPYWRLDLCRLYGSSKVLVVEKVEPYVKEEKDHE